LPELALGTLAACRDVFQAEIPHYFRHIYTDETSVAPRVEYAAGLGGPNPECVVSVIGCTGDWFGGWDGMTPGSADRFITGDFKQGRLPDVIARGEPAILVGHWPGMFFGGRETGFQILRLVVDRLHAAYDNLIWMKLSEIARYAAARALTQIERPEPGVLVLRAPFACPQFTIRLAAAAKSPEAVMATRLAVTAGGKTTPLLPARSARRLDAGTFQTRDRELTACFDLPRGESRIQLE
jgi:hypothetical protein